MTLPAREKYLPERYAFGYEDGIEFTMERFEDRRGTFNVELTVKHVNGTGEARMLDFATLNLVAPNSRRSLAKALHDEHGKVTAEEWQDRLRACSYLAVCKWREGGEPFVDLKSVPLDYSKPAMLLPPLVPTIGVTVVYGNGEVGKSQLVMGCAVTVATGQPVFGFDPADIGRVLYLDWEDNGEVQRERAEALCRGMGFEFPADSIIFRRMDRPLVDCEEQIKNAVAEHEIVLVVVDSLGMAVAGDPTEAGGMIAAMNALARVGVPAVVLSHLSQEQAYGKASKEKSYGPIYVRNIARMQWLVERDVENGGPVYLTNTKTNRGGRRERLAFECEVEHDPNDHIVSARYTAVSAASYREATGRVSDLDRVKQALYGIKAPVRVISQKTGLSEGQVRTVISRGADQFGSETRDRGEKWWWILSNQEEPEW